MKKILTELMVNNMFLTDFDFDQDKMCLKNEKDEVVFMFELLEGKSTIDALQAAVNKLKVTIDDAVNCA